MTGRGPITTHVLDTARGLPALGVPVKLEREASPGAWKLIGKSVTDGDGRASELLPADWPLELGLYRLTFETAAYFKTLKARTFYPVVELVFEITERRHHHVPLLLSP